jgi:hypothetical protein
MSGHPVPAPINDRLYDELLKPVVDAYYEAVRLHGIKREADFDKADRAWSLSRMQTLAEVGDRIADVLEVARPLWADMRALADPAYGEVAR